MSLTASNCFLVTSPGYLCRIFKDKPLALLNPAGFQRAQAVVVELHAQVFFLGWNHQPFGAAFGAAQVLHLRVEQVPLGGVAPLRVEEREISRVQHNVKRIGFPRALLDENVGAGKVARVEP